MLRGDLAPGHEAVAGPGCGGGLVVHVEDSAFTRPGVAEAVDNQGVIARLLGFPDQRDVALRGEGRGKRRYVVGSAPWASGRSPLIALLTSKDTCTMAAFRSQIAVRSVYYVR